MHLNEAYKCPKCEVDLTGKPIPETARKYYDNAKYFTKAIELYEKGWESSECGHRWFYNNSPIKEEKEQTNN